MILTELGPVTAYRMHTPRWATAPTSGAGAAAHGGRANRPGVTALYLALEPETAVREYQQLSPLMPPGTLVSYTVRLAPVVDFRGLSNALFEIANRRYTGKQRKQETFQIILQADGAIPYNTIASTMAAMRCKMPEFGKEPMGCALPTDDPDLKKAKDPISPDKTLFDTTRASYDPKTMALFSDILFSSGFE